MKDQKFKKHIFVLFAFFCLVTVLFIKGSQETVQVIYYLIPLGALYAIYIGLSMMRHENKIGHRKWFVEFSVRTILIETIVLGFGAFVLRQLIRLSSSTEIFAFGNSIFEDLIIAFISCFLGILLVRIVLRLINNPEIKNNNSKTK